MASTYKIYFTNTSGNDNNFAFFTDVPKTTGSSSPVYSNIIASQFVPSEGQGALWEVDISATYYAWCSVAPVPVASLPGTNVVSKMSISRLAQLGKSGSPGSTFQMVNNGGNPTFIQPCTFAAPDGSYQITSNQDFKTDQDFICGLGSVDGNGNRIPVATFAAQPNTIVTITPVVKFYIAQYGSSKGTIINTTTVSNKAAALDFTGISKDAAWVNQNSSGGWDIRYGTASTMRELSLAKTTSYRRYNDVSDSSRDQELMRLVSMFQRALESRGASTTTPTTTNVGPTLYACSLLWQTGNASQRSGAITALANYMHQRGYTVTSTPPADTDHPSFGVESPNALAQVQADWSGAVGAQGAYANTPLVRDATYVANGKQSGNGDRNGNGSGLRGDEYDDKNLDQLVKAARRLSGYSSF